MKRQNVISLKINFEMDIFRNIIYERFSKHRLTRTRYRRKWCGQGNNGEIPAIQKRFRLRITSEEGFNKRS